MASSGSDDDRRISVRFTVEQVEAMEIVFAQCPHPSAAKRREIKRTFPVLSNLDDTQIKLWFQNHRILKRHLEGSNVHTVREMLTITNNLLKEEHSTLMKKVQELISDNAFLKQQLLREDI